MITFLMVADIVNIIGLVLAVLRSGKDAADVGLALGPGTQAGRVGQQCLQELDGDDLLSLKIHGTGGQHSHILQTAHMVQVALTKGHKKPNPPNLRDIQCQTLNFLMVEQIHVLVSHLVEVIRPLDAHRGNFYPASVLPVTAGGGNFPQIDLRIKVGGESVAMVAAVAVQNINGVNGIKFMLLGVGAVRLGHTRVEAAAQQGGQPRLLKL